MMTRSVGQSTAAPRGRRTGGRTGKGGRRTRESRGRGDRRTSKPNDQGFEANEGVDGVLDRETVVGMAWADFKTLTREEFYPNNEMQKVKTEFWNHAMVGAGHAAYTDRFHELARLVPYLVTPKNKRIERNGSLKRNPERTGNGEEPSRDRNMKDDNKRTKTGNAFSITANPVRREYTGAASKCENFDLHHSPEMPCHACFNYNRLRHLAKDCRVVPRMVNPVNARNLTVAHGACFECGGTDHFKAACPRLNQAQRTGGNRPNQDVANNEGKVMGTTATKHVVEHLCWDQRRLARTQIS
nr:reverse transcriptase domain-containing protein [Tanacetum cinerariifolium]